MRRCGLKFETASAACAVDSAKSSHRANLCAPLARLELEPTDSLLGKLTAKTLPELYLESAHSVNYPFGRKGLCGDRRPPGCRASEARRFFVKAATAAPTHAGVTFWRFRHLIDR